MKIKKTLLIIMAIVLICAISVAGTLAYLKAETSEVKNTFVAFGGGNLFEDEDEDGEVDAEFVLNESKANQNTATGVYTLNKNEKVTRNDYSVVPGSSVPKDPAVSVGNKNEVPAYLYVEIVNNTNNIISFDIAEGWTLLANAEAPHEGGEVYVWKDKLVGDLGATPILAGDKVNVKNVDEDETLDFGTTNEVNFYAYLAQSVVGDYTEAVDVFNECF